MNINANRKTPPEETGPASPETPPDTSGLIDLDRLVWDVEYRRQINELLKRDQARWRESGGRGIDRTASGLAVEEISTNVLENC